MARNGTLDVPALLAEKPVHHRAVKARPDSARPDSHFQLSRWRPIKFKSLSASRKA